MQFVPSDSSIPEELIAPGFTLAPLLPAHAPIDYEAVMEDPALLRQWSQSDWPADDFTLAENIVDLERHAREHTERTAFTYTVLSPDVTRCVGCVYITPPGARTGPVELPPLHQHDPRVYSADVCFWVRASLFDMDFDTALLRTLNTWMSQDWAFDRVVFHTSRADVRQMEIFTREGFVELTLVLDRDPDFKRWVYFEWES